MIELNKKVARLVNDYNNYLKNNNIPSKNAADKELKMFLDEKFRPEVKKTCEEYKIEEKNCYPLKRKWNNASFAAYLTYENKLSKIKTLRERKNLDLRAFSIIFSLDLTNMKSRLRREILALSCSLNWK